MKALKRMIPKQQGLFVAVMVGLALGLVVPVQAASITLDAVDSGRYRSNGQHAAGSTNIVAGFGINNFFVFNLSGVTEAITSAELQVECSPTCASGSGTYTLYDVSTSISDLTSSKNSGDPLGRTIHNDLGTGTSYGSRGVSNADNGTTVNILLNSNAVNALNSATGLFAIGGSSGAQNYIFGNTSSGLKQLAIETSSVGSASTSTPEPATILLFGTGLVGMAAWRWKTSKRN